MFAAYPGSDVPRRVSLPVVERAAAGEVLCATRRLGICGTDREILQSREPAVPPGADFLVLGHECLAQVVEVGEGVSGMEVGEWVVPVVRRPLPRACEVAAERRRRPDMMALGEFTERGILYEHGFSQPVFRDRPEYLVRVPGELVELAVCAEPLAVVEKGINEALVLQTARLGDAAWPLEHPRVLVTGLGPIAFAGVLACRRRGWPVTIYGRDASGSARAELAQALGARYVPAEAWVEEPADVERDGFDLVLECTGSDAVMVRMASSLASCGILVWLGSSRVPRARELNMELVMRHAIIRNHLHLGSVNAARRDFEDALRTLAWWNHHAPRTITRIFTSHVRPSDALWHYTHREPNGIKCVVVME